MRKGKKYFYVKFSPKAIEEAWRKLDSFLTEDQRKKIRYFLTVYFSNENWKHDTESEFFADYQKNVESSSYYKNDIDSNFGIEISFIRPFSSVCVIAPKRDQIEEVYQIFEKYVDECKLPEDTEPVEAKPVVFIGHGQSDQWRDLKDHLQDKHGYKIDAYEVGARAGHAIRDVLEEMLSRSLFSILVMTGEDKDDKGNLRARDNVIHELGLFQGKLGFSRAIILLEEGTQEFSNIHGIQQIRYTKSNIKETFGEVLATLRREFNK